METIFRMNNLQNGKENVLKKVLNTLGHKEQELNDTDVMIKKTNGTKIKLFIR